MRAQLPTQPVVLPSPLRRLRVSACVPKDKGSQGREGHEPGLVWTALPWPALAAALAPGCLFGSSGCGLEPQRPNQTVELISQIGGPPAQIRPFPSSTNRQ